MHKIGSQILSSSAEELTGESAGAVRKWTFLGQISWTFLLALKGPLSRAVKSIMLNEFGHFEKYHFLKLELQSIPNIFYNAIALL